MISKNEHENSQRLEAFSDGVPAETVVSDDSDGSFPGIPAEIFVKTSKQTVIYLHISTENAFRVVHTRIQKAFTILLFLASFSSLTSLRGSYTHFVEPNTWGKRRRTKVTFSQEFTIIWDDSWSDSLDPIESRLPHDTSRKTLHQVVHQVFSTKYVFSLVFLTNNQFYKNTSGLG